LRAVLAADGGLSDNLSMEESAMQVKVTIEIRPYNEWSFVVGTAQDLDKQGALPAKEPSPVYALPKTTVPSVYDQSFYGNASDYRVPVTSG